MNRKLRYAYVDFTLEDIKTWVNDTTCTHNHMNLVGMDTYALAEAIDNANDKEFDSICRYSVAFVVTRSLHKMTGNKGDDAAPISTAEGAPDKAPEVHSEEDPYAGLFDTNAEESSYSAKAWIVRQQFLKELSEKGGTGCSGCVRGTLLRKYKKMLEDVEA